MRVASGTLPLLGGLDGIDYQTHAFPLIGQIPVLGEVALIAPTPHRKPMVILLRPVVMRTHKPLDGDCAA